MKSNRKEEKAKEELRTGEITEGTDKKNKLEREFKAIGIGSESVLKRNRKRREEQKTKNK